MINETPEGQLGKYLIGDLAVARRHLARIKDGTFAKGVPLMVLDEISRSIEDCVSRIQRDVKDLPAE
jgi:hypothetical protein